MFGNGARTLTTVSTPVIPPMEVPILVQSLSPCALSAVVPGVITPAMSRIADQPIVTISQLAPGTPTLVFVLRGQSLYRPFVFSAVICGCFI